MFKVELIAFNKEHNGFVNSIGVEMAYLFSALKTVQNSDAQCFTYCRNEVDIATKDCFLRKPSIIGISILQINYNESIDFIKKIKQKLPDVYILIFGKEASNYPVALLQMNPFIDIAIVGEGENTFKEVVFRLSHGKDLDDCQGVVYRNKHGNVVKNQNRCLEEDLDSLPFPEIKLLKKAGNTYYITGSRGCTGNCSFCWTNSVEKQPGIQFRARSIKSIADELKILKNKGDVKYLAFADSVFADNEQNLYNRCVELFDVLTELNMDIRFTLNLRTDIVDECSIKGLKQLLLVGLDRIFLGIESGNDDDLRLYGKAYDVQNNSKCINLMYSENVPFDYGFIMFNPYSTYKSLKQNIDFIKDNKLYPYMEKITSALFIQSGAPIVKKLNNDGLLKCEYNKPIINPWAFKYVDPKIELIVGVMKQVNKEYPIRKDDIVKAQSLLRNAYAKDVRRDLLKTYENVLIDFLDTSSIYNLALLNNVIDLVFDGCINDKYFMIQKDNKYFDIIKLWDEVKVARKKLSLYMARNNILYV